MINKTTNIVETKLARIAQISREKPKEVFTSIYHLLNEEMLMKCHKELNGKKATGLDGITKAEYEENLEENIKELAKEIQNMSFVPSPAKRIYIPKLSSNIENGKVSYIVDADIKGYFDHINHEWLIRCVEQHINDPRIIRMIKRFLRAGIIENTEKIETTEGTPQRFNIKSSTSQYIYVLCNSIMV